MNIRIVKNVCAVILIAVMLLISFSLISLSDVSAATKSKTKSASVRVYSNRDLFRRRVVDVVCVKVRMKKGKITKVLSCGGANAIRSKLRTKIVGKKTVFVKGYLLEDALPYPNGHQGLVIINVKKYIKF